MWFVVFVIGGPIIYMIVDYIIDSVSDKIKEIKRCGIQELLYITTYKNNKINENDIIRLFISQSKKYAQYYYYLDYVVYDEKEKQNYAWSIKTIKHTYSGGIIYDIKFYFSNGYVNLAFSNSSFSLRGQTSKKYFDSSDIEKILDTCKDEARIKWKMNGKEPKENLPFNYIPLSEGDMASKESKDENGKEDKSSYTNTAEFDLLSFYRNLFGLKLCFSGEELKKSYLAAVKKYHPDKYSSSSRRDRENAEMLMKQVNEAYEKLKKVAI